MCHRLNLRALHTCAAMGLTRADVAVLLEAAMRGAEWSWKHDQDQLHRMCALLAGLCITFTGQGSGTDAIRKQDAFCGRVQLPFLETNSPPNNAARIAWIPHQNEWLVYRVRGSPRACRCAAPAWRGWSRQCFW